MKGAGEIYVVGTASPPGDLSEAKVDLGGIVVELEQETIKLVDALHSEENTEAGS